MTSNRSGSFVALELLAGGILFAAEPAGPHRLADLSLEELMNETVTSVSKREERLSDAAAAVTSLSDLDLRSDGATTVPDLLRMVPGVEVAASNAREWAVSARGFNQVYSNKFLVLVDGRAVYTPLFRGVFWDLQQRMIDDLDRIEIIRGPGGSIWGSNAVNGVVNIISKDARETQGALVFAAAGNILRDYAGVRYGGSAGNSTWYRVFAQSQSIHESPNVTGGYSDDDWSSYHFGFRIDHAAEKARHLTFQSDATTVNADGYRAYNINALARMDMALPASDFEVQAYFDRVHTDDLTRARQTTDTLDFSAQQVLGEHGRTKTVWGMGAQYFASSIEETSPAIRVQHHRPRRHVLSAFAQVQDQSWSKRLTLIGGIKLEHSSYIGLEIQPTLRLSYKPVPTQTAWFAASRAVRIPGEIEGKDTAWLIAGSPIAGPGGGLYLPVVEGNTNLRSEVLYAVEAGWRVRTGNWLTLDTTIFHNTYSRLISYGAPARFEPGTPIGTAWIPWRNALRATSYGAELAAVVNVSPRCRLETAYSALSLQVRGDPAYAYGQTMSQLPTQQASVRVVADFGTDLDASAQLRWVAAMPGVPSYTTADLRVCLHRSTAVELSFVGRNLFAPLHFEQPRLPFTASAGVPRSLYLRLDHRF